MLLLLALCAHLLPNSHTPCSAHAQLATARALPSPRAPSRFLHSSPSPSHFCSPLPLPPPAAAHCSNLPVVTEVAKSLAFAPALHALADRVVAGVTGGGAHPFNGVHLRVEKDARDWATIMGGTQVVWQGYVDTMRGVGFNATTRLYAASGMLTYGASGARVGGVWGGGGYGRGGRMGLVGAGRGGRGVGRMECWWSQGMGALGRLRAAQASHPSHASPGVPTPAMLSPRPPPPAPDAVQWRWTAPSASCGTRACAARCTTRSSTSRRRSWKVGWG